MPKAIIMKNDANYVQGIPDWIVIDQSGVYIFEIKRNKCASRQPNQEYYINYFRKLGYYAAIVYPENEEEVLDAIQRP